MTRLLKRATGVELNAPTAIHICPAPKVLSVADATVTPLTRAVIVLPRQLSSTRLVPPPRLIAGDDDGSHR